MTDPEASKPVDDAASALKEHFDAVIVIASRDYPENERLTQIIHRGRGNWFAQRGMLREILEDDTARVVAYHVNKEKEE